MKLLKKFLQFSVGNVVALAIGFVSYPVIVRLIAPEEMGKFSIFSTFISMIMLVATLGTDQAYVRFFYEEDENERVSLFRKCIFAPLILCVILCVLSVLFGRKLSGYLVGEYSKIFILMICVHTLGCVLERFVLLHVRMEQKAKLYSMYSILIKVLYVIGVAVLYCVFRNSYLTLVIATVISNLFVMLIAVLNDRRFYFRKVEKRCKISYSKIFHYSVPLIFSTLITWIFQSTDKLMLKEFSGYQQVGIYSGAMTLISMLNVVQTAFTTFWVPVAYEHYTKNDKDTDFFVFFNSLVSFAMLIIATGLISCKDIIRVLLGTSYAESAYVFPFLVFMPIMYTISETTVVGINFKEKTKAHIWIATGAALFNIIGNYILVPILGAKGAAISTGLSYVVFFILRTIFSISYYKVSYKIKRFLISSMVVYVVASINSFANWNWKIFVMEVFVVVFICIMYFDIVHICIERIKSFCTRSRR